MKSLRIRALTVSLTIIAMLPVMQAAAIGPMGEAGGLNEERPLNADDYVRNALRMLNETLQFLQERETRRREAKYFDADYAWYEDYLGYLHLDDHPGDYEPQVVTQTMDEGEYKIEHDGETGTMDADQPVKKEYFMDHEEYFMAHEELVELQELKDPDGEDEHHVVTEAVEEPVSEEHVEARMKRSPDNNNNNSRFISSITSTGRFGR